MKRLLLHQNEAKFNAITGLFHKMLPSLKKLEAAYKALNIGDFDNDVFNDIKENGYSNIRGRFEAELNKQLDAAGVTFPSLRKQQFDGSLYPLREFYETLNEVPDKVDGEYRVGVYGVHYITYLLSYSLYEDGEFVAVSKDSKELILEEFCRTYTENETEYKAWQAGQEFMKAYNNLKEVLEESGASGYFIDNGTSRKGRLKIDSIVTERNGEASIDHSLITDIRGYLAGVERKRILDEKKAEKDRKKKEEYKERLKNSFDISTPEGSAAFNAYSAQQEHIKRQENAEQEYYG